MEAALSADCFPEAARAQVDAKCGAQGTAVALASNTWLELFSDPAKGSCQTAAMSTVASGACTVAEMHGGAIPQCGCAKARAKDYSENAYIVPMDGNRSAPGPHKSPKSRDPPAKSHYFFL